MLSISILASGSKANSCLVRTDSTPILVDAGLSRRETFIKLAALGVNPETVNVIVTHEHGDHAGGIPAITKGINVPVYTTEIAAPFLKLRDHTPREFFRPGQRFTIGDIDVMPFDIPHDAAEPVGFSLMSQGIKITIATDLGSIPEHVAENLIGSDLLLLEANHCLEILRCCPYPSAVRMRIAGANGHLSNELAGRFVKEQMDNRTSVLIFGHRSAQANHPEICRVAGEEAIRGRDTKFFLADEVLGGEFTF